MNKLIDEAPYHPGYEDAVVIERRSEPVYKGLDARKMLWKSKPMSDQKLLEIAAQMFHYTEYKNAITFARLIEKAHGIK